MSLQMIPEFVVKESHMHARHLNLSLWLKSVCQYGSTSLAMIRKFYLLYCVWADRKPVGATFNAHRLAGI